MSTSIDLSGKKALIMGVANARSLGWAIGKRLAEAGAELAVTYQAERFREQVASKEAGDLEAMHYDADYVRALESRVETSPVAL